MTQDNMRDKGFELTPWKYTYGWISTEIRRAAHSHLFIQDWFWWPKKSKTGWYYNRETPVSKQTLHSLLRVHQVLLCAHGGKGLSQHYQGTHGFNSTKVEAAETKKQCKDSEGCNTGHHICTQPLNSYNYSKMYTNMHQKIFLIS